MGHTGMFSDRIKMGYFEEFCATAKGHGKREKLGWQAQLPEAQLLFRESSGNVFMLSAMGAFSYDSADCPSNECSQGDRDMSFFQWGQH